MRILVQTTLACLVYGLLATAAEQQVRDVVRRGGWPIPGQTLIQKGTVKPSEISSFVVEGTPVTSELYTFALSAGPENLAMVPQLVRDGDTVYLSEYEMAPLSVKVYKARGSVVCYFVEAVPYFRSDDPARPSSFTSGYFQIAYYDRTGNGKFEHLEQPIFPFELKLPQWVKEPKSH